MNHTIQAIFAKGLELHHYANTAYPLDGKKVWGPYRVHEEVDRAVYQEWNGVDELGLYVHIPFCKQRCRYCEYTVLSGAEAELKEVYVDLLSAEIGLYRRFMAGKQAAGLDIGGGTPTILDIPSLERILTAAVDGYRPGYGFGISIETTPIIATDEEKMRSLRQLGIERISMGLQTVDPALLNTLGRIDSSLSIYLKARDNIRKAGFEKYNIDLMYGFANESLTSLVSTVQFAMDLGPEYITLYRNRFKGTKLEDQTALVSLDHANQFYDAAYELLTGNGYEANIGKNTFSKIKGDPGTSAYLTRRVVDGLPYLGMGLGAQSMSPSSIYYNQGAASKNLSAYRQRIGAGLLPIQDLYLLPADEIMAKMICVSFYFGSINKESFERRFGTTLLEQFPEEVRFLLDKCLMEDTGRELCLTRHGKDSVNGIIPLFYSLRSKQNLLSKVTSDV